jgi:hypothetical protein
VTRHSVRIYRPGLFLLTEQIHIICWYVHPFNQFVVRVKLSLTFLLRVINEYLFRKFLARTPIQTSSTRIDVVTQTALEKSEDCVEVHNGFFLLPAAEEKR